MTAVVLSATSPLSAAGAPAAPAAPARRGRGDGPRVEWLHDWTLTDCARLADLAWASAEPIVPVRADGAEVLVGPVQHSEAPVCLECAEFGRATARFGVQARDDLRRRGLVSPAVSDAVAELVANVVREGLTGSGRVWIVDGRDLTVSARAAAPRHTGCTRCHPLPGDSPDRVTALRRSGVVSDPASLRSVNPLTTLPRLRAALVDPSFGPVRTLGRSDRISLPIAYAEVADRRLDGDGGYGRATQFADAERVALFEALERITGMRPGRAGTRLRASWRELGPELALDPRRLGEYEPEAQRHPRFALAPFAEDLPVSWVWGHSQARGGPLAVPEQAAYWGVPAPRGEGVLAESSNGCGLGNSLEEAALYGLLELIERDAFLIAWWARAPLPRIAFPLDDPFLAMLRARLDSLGYEPLLLDATTDLGVPVVATVALHRDPTSQAPQAFVAAGAHPRRRDAIRSALLELVVNVEHAPSLSRAGTGAFDRSRLRDLLRDPARIETIDDHVGVNALPEARGRFDALLSGPPPGAGAGPERDEELLAQAADNAVVLDCLRQRAQQAGVDTIVVDQTPERVRRELGLYAARVVAPGLLSLTFGHLYRRTRGLARLLHVPVQLGHLAAAPAYELLPFDPHPFP